MGRYDGVENASVTEGGNYFSPGNYVVMVNECKEGETRKGLPFNVVNCRVIESDNPEFRPGSEVCWWVDMTKDAAKGNVKQFAMAATEAPASDINKKGLSEIFGEDQHLSDIGPGGTPLIIRVNAYNKNTQAGKPFTRLKWVPLNNLEKKTFLETAKKLGLVSNNR